MSLNNAKVFANKNKAKWEIESKETKNAAKKLQNILKIKDELKRIECYDISHLSGEGTVGSMIVFENAVPKKEMYRKFKLRTIQGKVDDYKSLEEVLTRRFSKISQKIIHKDYKFKRQGDYFTVNINDQNINVYYLPSDIEHIQIDQEIK